MEPKTFGELSLRDKLYLVTDDDYQLLSITKIEDDGDNKNNVLINVGSDNEYSLPSTEYEHTLDGIKFTCDKNTWKRWIKPFVEQKIKKLRKELEEKTFAINEQIEELEKMIPS